MDWELIARGCAGWTGADIAVSCSRRTSAACGVAGADAWDGRGGDDESQVLYTPESVGQLSLARSGMTKNLLRRGLIPPDTRSEHPNRKEPQFTARRNARAAVTCGEARWRRRSIYGLWWWWHTTLTFGEAGRTWMWQNLMNEAAIQAIREGNDAMQERHIVDALENLKRDSLTQGGQKVQRNSGSQEEMDALPMTVKRSICLIEAVRARPRRPFNPLKPLLSCCVGSSPSS